MRSRRFTGQWLTTAEVMAVLRVAEGTVYRLVRSAALPAARVGGQWRFRAREVEDWLARQRRAVGPGMPPAHRQPPHGAAADGSNAVPDAAGTRR